MERYFDSHKAAGNGINFEYNLLDIYLPSIQFIRQYLNPSLINLIINLNSLTMSISNLSCQLCERAPFLETAQPSVYSCSLCFELIKASQSFTVTNILSKEKLILKETHDNRQNSEYQFELQNIQSQEKNYNIFEQVVSYRRELNSQKQNPQMVIDNIYLTQIERIIKLWKVAKSTILQATQITKANILKNSQKSNLLCVPTSPLKQQIVGHPKLNEKQICQIVKQINKINPKQMLEDNFFSLRNKIYASESHEVQILKKQSKINKVLFSCKVSNQNSRNSLSKYVPNLELNKMKSHKNLTCIQNITTNSQVFRKTQALNTKNQIEWLIQNDNHNPQGFRDTTRSNNNTSRRIATQPMAECITEALKFTTVNNKTLSLTNFDISKTALDCYLNMTSWSDCLNTIKLVKVGLLDHQFNLLLCFAARNPSLKNILVTNNNLTSQSLQMLLNFVKKIKQLQKVYMGNNHIKALNSKDLLKQIKEHGIQSIYI